ncbi:retrovirus-related pol polyprotein from transposon TNT 1-94 [Tanacetum coccineum]
MQQDQENKSGHIDDQPDNEAAPKHDWFQKPDKPPTPDRAWNKSKSVNFRPPQKWISTIAKARQPPRTFDELMGTPINFSAYVMNRLKIDNLTQEILVGPAFNLLKGSCKSFAELEYQFEECYKAVNDRLDWHNLEGREYPFELSKPLPLIENRGRIEDMVPTLWSPVKVAYNKHAVWGTYHRGLKRQRFYVMCGHQKHSISLEIALQECQEQLKNDIVCKEKASNVFRKEREQYFEIQDLKAQLQDKELCNMMLYKIDNKGMEMVDRTTMPIRYTMGFLRQREIDPIVNVFPSSLILLQFVQTINSLLTLDAQAHGRAIYLCLCNFVDKFLGNDLLTGNRGTDLYTISLQETTSSTLICLMAKASPTQAWLWHRRLSHLNFDYINLLSKKDVVIGLPNDANYGQDQLCSSCEVSKAKRSSFKSKTVPSSKGWLNLLHMDLCGPMRVASINGKKYILPSNAVRTDRAWVLNKTLNAFFNEEGIELQPSTSRHMN